MYKKGHDRSDRVDRSDSVFGRNSVREPDVSAGQSQTLSRCCGKEPSSLSVHGLTPFQAPPIMNVSTESYKCDGVHNIRLAADNSYRALFMVEKLSQAFVVILFWWAVS